MNIWDQINPIKQVERGLDATRNGDLSGAIRAGMDPIGGAVGGWKKDDAAVPAPYLTDEEIAQREYKKKQQGIVDDQIAQTKAFRGQIPGYENSLYNQIEGEAKKAISDKQREISRQAKRRGLLYSGLKTGDQTRAASHIASDAASSKAKVAPELERLAETMDAMAAKTAQANYKDDLTVMSQVYDRALSDAKNRTAALGQLGESAGQFAGQYFGSRNAESDTYERQKREYSMGINPDGTISRSKY